MVQVENDCVGCEYCINCGRREVSHWYCDDCGEEAEKLYNVDGEDLCESCIEQRFEKTFYADLDPDTRRCAECDSDEEDYYKYDGQYICRKCLLAHFDLVYSESGE